MNKKTTPSQSLGSKVGEKNVETPYVSEKTLAFLRAFASNYCVEPQLPKGMQTIILG